MSLFKRAKPDPIPDDHLPLGVDDATHLRQLTRVAFAEAGYEVEVFADHVVDAEGAQFGLWNLAAVCHDEPRRNWPRVIADHVRRITAPQLDVEQLGDRELEGSTYWRLVETASLLDPEAYPSRHQIGEQLTALLSIDLPDAVSTPKEDFWVERGGVAQWAAIGRANLLALLVSDDLSHERLHHPGGAGEFDVVMGDSFFAASVVLHPEHLVRRFSGAESGPSEDFPEMPESGILVAMPFRHQLAFRVVDGTPDSAMALQNMFRFALLGFSDAPGPLSPHVYWVHQGRWEQVTQFVEDEPRVVVSEELATHLGINRMDD